MKPRKSPIRHKVKSHTRKRGRVNVHSYTRGNGLPVRRISWRVRVGQLPQFVKTSDLTPEGFVIIPYEDKRYPKHGKIPPLPWQRHVVQVKSFHELRKQLNELKKEKYGFNRIDIGAPTKPQVKGTVGFHIIGSLSWNGYEWVEGLLQIPELEYPVKGIGSRRDFNSRELAIGIETEMEHTTDPKEAEKIAKEHLTDIPDYYTRLAKLKAAAKAEGQRRIGYGNSQPELWVSTSKDIIIPLSVRNKHIIRILKLEGATSVNELSRRVGLNPQTIRVELNYLKTKNLVKPV